MRRIDAHTLLNAARAGADIADEAITEALYVTGDIAPPRRVISRPCDEEPDDFPVVHCWRHAGQWERSPCAGVIALATPFDGLLA